MRVAHHHPLLDSLTLGALTLGHHIVLVGAPAGLGVMADGAPDPSLAAYFAGLATPGGLLICAADPSAAHSSSDQIPRIHSAPQVNAWRAVTEAILARGGLAIVQLGDAAKGERALPDLDGIEAALLAYRAAAENAADAGFDGVELLCTRGTLADRLLAPSSCGVDAVRDPNFALDALQAVVGCWASSNVGVCLSQPEKASDVPLARSVLASAQSLGLAYAHLVSTGSESVPALEAAGPPLRMIAPGRLIVSGGWTLAAAAAAIEAGEVDAVGVNREFALEAGLHLQASDGRS
jgi:N-ethylmaleimide reductase